MELLVKVVEDRGGCELVASSIIGQSHQVEHGAEGAARRILLLQRLIIVQGGFSHLKC